jgi:integrase
MIEIARPSEGAEDAAEGEWRTLILVAYFTGQRLSDCTRMAWADLDLAGGIWTLKQGKTGAALAVPLHPELLTHLESLAGSDAPARHVMPHLAELGPGGRHGLSEGFKRVARKAGVDTMPIQGGGKRMVARRTFHALRHSFTSALLNAGVAPELRMKLTGHKSAEVHRGYSHAEMETLRAAVAKLPCLH